MLFFFNHNNDYNNILKSDWLSNRTSCRPIGPAIILVIKRTGLITPIIADRIGLSSVLCRY